MIPDIVQDSVTDACRRLGVQFVESLFYSAALNAGFGARSEDRAREVHIQWARGGYQALPVWVKQYILEVMDGQHGTHC